MGNEHIVCVDDESILLQSLRQELKADEFFSALAIDIVDSGRAALELIGDILREGDEIPALISDQRMPSMSGEELLLKTQALIPDTSKILLTGYSDIGAVVNLVNGNALYRYLSKPWDRKDLLLTIREACRAYRQKRLVAELSSKIERLTFAMVTVLESTNFYFDEETGDHIERVSLISEFIARKAGLDESFVKLVKLYSLLHDIGKVGLDKEILLKPGRLTAEEFEKVKAHVSIGHQILGNSAIDVMAKNIVLYHHEKWAGNGYVSGLKGDAIPLEARIVAIADVFDALVSERVYKRAFTYDEAKAIIEKEKGISFDPRLVEVFLEGISSVSDPQALFGSPKLN